MTATNTIKEIGMVFSPEMNRAVLANKKNVTRRLKGLQEINKKTDAWSVEGRNINDDFLFFNQHARIVGYDPPDCIRAVKCPYGKIGDRIYIKETYAVNEHEETSPCWYAADFEQPREAAKSLGIKWLGGIYMAKRFARTYLEITAIRVERVQDISGAGAIVEGVLCADEFDFTVGYECAKASALHKFQRLWKKLNGEQSWNDNPYVWVIEFKRILTT